MTLGLNGSDIQNFVNIAILNAVKDHRKRAEFKDFEDALDRISIGILNKSIEITPKDKYMTAIHEAGHAMVSLLNKEAFKMNKVTILSKGGSLGYFKKPYSLYARMRHVLYTEEKCRSTNGRSDGRKSSRRFVFWQ